MMREALIFLATKGTVLTLETMGCSPAVTGSANKF